VCGIGSCTPRSSARRGDRLRRGRDRLHDDGQGRGASPADPVMENGGASIVPADDGRGPTIMTTSSSLAASNEPSAEGSRPRSSRSDDRCAETTSSAATDNGTARHGTQGRVRMSDPPRHDPGRRRGSSTGAHDLQRKRLRSSSAAIGPRRFLSSSSLPERDTYDRVAVGSPGARVGCLVPRGSTPHGQRTTGSPQE
jgi:hypothetical protein